MRILNSSVSLGKDIWEEPNQAIPDKEMIERLLETASAVDPVTGEKVLTISDVAAFSHIRRSESKAKNPQFMLDTAHKIFGSGKWVFICFI